MDLNKVYTMNKKIVIIGGGFAGTNLAKKLADKEGFDITLVDQNNYNFFQPLLYQVATGFLEVSNITFPFRKLFAGKKNIRFRMAKLEAINHVNKTVTLDNGILSFDYLVLATGTVSNFFGMKNIENNSLPMKTISDAVYIRDFFLSQGEKATLVSDPHERKKLRTIVIAGGGPTGVELAGMLAETKKKLLQEEYQDLQGVDSEIYLIDAMDTLLSPMSKKSQQYTRQTLEEMGVKVLLDKQVKDYSNDAVEFADGSHLLTKQLIWTAGVTARKFEGIPDHCYGKGGRLIVDEYNMVIGIPNVFAVGDTCIQSTDAAFPNGHPQLAQVAIQQGENLASNFLLTAKGKDVNPFRYKDKGSMAIIGKSKAVAEIPKPKLFFKGFMAWISWLVVHLFSLMNFRNVIKTSLNWIMAFITNDQSLRIIERPSNIVGEKKAMDL